MRIRTLDILGWFDARSRIARRMSRRLSPVRNRFRIRMDPASSPSKPTALRQANTPTEPETTDNAMMGNGPTDLARTAKAANVAVGVGADVAAVGVATVEATGRKVNRIRKDNRHRLRAKDRT